MTATGYRYTGQLDMQGSIGLDYYVARFYDPQLARFAQADTLIPDPGKSVSFDRYAYVKNNPIKFTDPKGHDAGFGSLGLTNEAYRYLNGTINSNVAPKYYYKWQESITSGRSNELKHPIQLKKPYYIQSFVIIK